MAQWTNAVFYWMQWPNFSNEIWGLVTTIPASVSQTSATSELPYLTEVVTTSASSLSRYLASVDATSAGSDASGSPGRVGFTQSALMIYQPGYTLVRNSRIAQGLASQTDALRYNRTAYPPAKCYRQDPLSCPSERDRRPPQ